MEPRGGLEDEPSVCPLWEDRLPDGESELPGQGEHFVESRREKEKHSGVFLILHINAVRLHKSEKTEKVAHI